MQRPIRAIASAPRQPSTPRPPPKAAPPVPPAALPLLPQGTRAAFENALRPIRDRIRAELTKHAKAAERGIAPTSMRLTDEIILGSVQLKCHLGIDTRAAMPFLAYVTKRRPPPPPNGGGGGGAGKNNKGDDEEDINPDDVAKDSGGGNTDPPEPTPPPPPPPGYEITVTTGNGWTDGTDAIIGVTLYGDRGTVGAYTRHWRTFVCAWFVCVLGGSGRGRLARVSCWKDSRKHGWSAGMGASHALFTL